ncbi:retrovirus-related Pol polyprotein from transposon 17.6 [Trichonephila clavipes]|nr:retrovirus-related Pol polyprotein from transposon 17.6 [Trichonephila clavipes]
MKKFNQFPYKLTPPTPIHVPAEKRPLEEKSLPKKRSNVRITPVMRRVSRRSELPMAPVQIPQPPMQIPKVPQPPVLIPQPPGQIPQVPQPPVQILQPPVQIPDVLEPVQIPDVLEPVQIPDVLEPVQIPLVPQSPVQIPVSQVPVTCAGSTYADSSVTSPTVTCADSTYADSICSRTCADSSVTSPTATYADSTCAYSRCSRTCADSSVTSPTVTYADSTCAKTTYAASPRARYFGPFGVDRCIRPANVVRIWSPRTPAASHDDLVKNLLQNIDSEKKQRAAGELITEFQSVFSRTSEDFRRTRLTKHRIDTGEHPPIKQHQRRLPFAKQEEVQKLIKDIKNNDVIEPPSSPWAFPILVRKKDGSTRLCVDYHLKSGYWQVELHPDDKKKTAFTTGQGLWQFKVMPFGLCNAPATFERLMETVLGGLSYEACLVYLDDIITVGRSFEEHLKNIGRVLQKLKEANLKLSPYKSHLFRREDTYHGHIISGEGVPTDPDKISAVKDWNCPTDVHQLRPGIPHEIWKQFILDTDANHESIEAVLSQEIDGQERVITYFSKCLSKPERNYCVTRKELLAIVKVVEHFHPYLYGRRFLLRTDHASLTWLLNFKNSEGQIARWIQRLQEYDVEIRHRKGSAHGNADALSRRPCLNSCKHCSRIEKKFGVIDQTVRQVTTPSTSALDPWTDESIRKDQLADPEIKPILEFKESSDEKLSWQDITPFHPTTKRYCALWDSLHLRNDVLYRKWEFDDGKTFRW